MPAEKLDRKQLIEVIHAKQGVLSQVARALGVHLTTIYNYRDRYATVAAAIDDARNVYDTELLDEAEIKHREAVRNGEPWAIKYVLDKKGRARGYGDTVRVENSGETTIRVVYGDDG